MALFVAHIPWSPIVRTYTLLIRILVHNISVRGSYPHSDVTVTRSTIFVGSGPLDYFFLTRFWHTKNLCLVID